MITTTESKTTEQIFLIPGTDQVLTYLIDAESQLLQSIVGGDRVYWERMENDTVIFDNGFVEFFESRIENGVVRRVSGSAGEWREYYLLDDKKRPVHVDGVDIIRDKQDRVVACIEKSNDILNAPHEWFYSYQAQGLVSVEGPGVRRQIALDDSGQVLSWRGNEIVREFSYGPDGDRKNVQPLPEKTFHRDNLGRLWTITDAAGNIKYIFLWDGLRCFARIDGSLGKPLSAVFSLDPTATPVRVITRNEVVRIPRDAYGEGLLKHRGVPGLFGATVFDQLAYLPWRVLDPQVGAFCSPDPYDGNEEDPRRGPDAAWGGPLPVEPDGENRFYTVCRNDPIGRADPTGAISAGLLISDFTWSLQNNMLIFFSMDWTLNFLISLFTGFQVGEFGSTEGLKSSDRMGAFALRRDGIFVNSGTDDETKLRNSRAFTTQHIVWATANDFMLLERGRVIDPKERFEPTLYGALLLAQPKDQLPFILVDGGGKGPVKNWTRFGGPAEPVAPGSLIPKFPTGGFHFDVVDPPYSSNIDCPLTELVPGSAVARGTLQDRATIDLLPSGNNPSAGDLVLLVDNDDDMVLTLVASAAVDAGRQLIRLDDDSPGIGPKNVTMRIMEKDPKSTEARTAEAAVNNSFTAVGASHSYSSNDLLRFTDTGTGDITVAKVEKLEAQLPLDRALPNTFKSPIQVSTTTINATKLNPKRTGNDTLEFAAGKAPAVGSMGLVSSNGQAIPVRVTGTPSADTVQVDTDVSAASAVNDPVDYQGITVLNPIGKREGAVEGALQFTYKPNESGKAPDGSGSTIILRFDADTDIAVRRITGAATYDAVVADRAVAGPGPWNVDRFVKKEGPPDFSGLTITQAASLVARPSNIVDDAKALRLQLVDLVGTPPAPDPGTTLFTGVNINGGVFTNSDTPGNQPTGPGPGDVVIGDDGAKIETLLVHKVRLTPTFDRNLDVGEKDLKAVPLGVQKIEWTASRVDKFWLDITGVVGSPDTPAPGFQIGERLRIAWNDGTNNLLNTYRITSVSGLRIGLGDGPEFIAGSVNFRVSRLIQNTPGFQWEASRVANDMVTIGGQAEGMDTQFPRFQTGEIVQINWVDGGNQESSYRISKVQGLTITLEGGDTIGAPATNILVQRLIPGNPGTGDSILARDGVRKGAGPANQITFSVWQPNAFPEGTNIGIISGDKTFPAVVTGANQDCEITFSAHPGLGNPSDIKAVQPKETGHAARFVREGDTILISDDTAGLSTGANEELLIVPFKTSDVAAKSARLHPGSLLVPQDEGTEIDRRQSLIDHELAHTVQYSKWGPLWFCLFPTFILELGLELGTDTDLPNYTEFQPAEVELVGTEGKLKFKGGSLSLSEKDTVQLVQGGSLKTAEVTKIENNEFFLKADKSSKPLPSGELQVRRRNQNMAADVFMNIFQGSTHGGLNSYIAGSLWSGIIWLFAKGVYGLHRARIGTGDVFPATVKAGGKELELTDDKGKQEVKAGQIIVKSGKSSAVRSATKNENILTVDQPVTFTGTVNVASYGTHDPGSAFDWLDYFPATVTKANPFVIEVANVNGKGPGLGIRDRVEINYLNKTDRNSVMSVNGNTIGLEDPIPISGDELSLRIAKVGTRDPMGNSDSIVMEELGLTWMRWLFDPWGRIQLEAQAENTFLDVFLRAIRYTMGTQNWSVLAPPFFGYLFWWRLFKESSSHTTAVEQNASEESGDTYSPMGRFYGQCKQTGAYGHYTMLVGDTARYYLWPYSSEENYVVIGRQSNPGVHSDPNNFRLIPFPEASGPAGEPNEQTQVAAGEADPAVGLPDLLVAKDPAAPTKVAGVITPTGFIHNLRGMIPTAPTTQRHLGGYTAFTKPGEYRATTPNTLWGGSRAREAHDDEAQTIYFNVTVLDVTVSVNGIEINEGDKITLVLTQEATVKVDVPNNDNLPGGARQFRTTLFRPDDGEVLRQKNNRVLAAQTNTGTEKVEVSRFYDFDEDKSTYTDESFSRFGFHLGGDIHIPVRQFEVEVADTLPMRADANPATAAGDLKQGSTGFLLVPATVVDPPELKTFDGRAPKDEDPKITIKPVESPPQAAKDFVGTQGAVFEISFAADPAVAASTVIVLETKVGSGAGTPLPCTFNLVP